jgi:hypothetical protein
MSYTPPLPRVPTMEFGQASPGTVIPAGQVVPAATGATQSPEQAIASLPTGSEPATKQRGRFFACDLKCFVQCWTLWLWSGVVWCPCVSISVPKVRYQVVCLFVNFRSLGHFCLQLQHMILLCFACCHLASCLAPAVGHDLVLAGFRFQFMAPMFSVFFVCR